MIFFYESGRLGNQLFQYFGIKTFFPSEKIIFIGDFSDLEYTIKPDNLSDSYFTYLNLGTSISKQLFSKLFFLFLIFLTKTRLICTASFSEATDEYSCHITMGLFHQITFIKKSFFQHHKVVENFRKFDFCKMINKDILDTSKKWFYDREISIDSRSVERQFEGVEKREEMSYSSLKSRKKTINLLWHLLELLSSLFSSSSALATIRF